MIGLVDIRGLQMLFGLSEQMVYKLVRDGEIPKPLKLGAAARWTFEEVAAIAREQGRTAGDVFELQLDFRSERQVITFLARFAQFGAFALEVTDDDIRVWVPAGRRPDAIEKQLRAIDPGLKWRLIHGANPARPNTDATERA
jgi:predicted DNA-binding transcriptional regulator AlpA